MSLIYNNLRTDGVAKFSGTNIFGNNVLTTYTMPTSRGVNLDILNTDASGNLSWITPTASRLYTSGSPVVINSTAPPDQNYALITTSSAVATWQPVSSIDDSYTYVKITTSPGLTNYNALITDNVIACDTSSSNPLNILLPAISSLTNGKKKYIICDEAGSASNGTKSITITPNGTDTINNGTSTLITKGYSSITILSNTTNNWIIF